MANDHSRPDGDFWLSLSSYSLSFNEELASVKSCLALHRLARIPLQHRPMSRWASPEVNFYVYLRGISSGQASRKNGWTGKIPTNMIFSPGRGVIWSSSIEFLPIHTTHDNGYRHRSRARVVSPAAEKEVDDGSLLWKRL